MKNKNRATVNYFPNKRHVTLSIALVVIAITLVVLSLLITLQSGSDVVWLVALLLFLAMLLLLFVTGILTLVLRWKLTRLLLIVTILLSLVSAFYLLQLLLGVFDAVAGHTCVGFFGVRESCIVHYEFFANLLVLNPLSLGIEFILAITAFIVQITNVKKGNEHP